MPCQVGNKLWVAESHIYDHICANNIHSVHKNAHCLYPHQKYRFIPNKQGQLLCTSCTSLKKNQQKKQDSHGFTCFWRHISSKKRDSKDPNFSSVWCLFLQLLVYTVVFFLESLSSKNGLGVFCETSVRPDLTKKTKGWTNKHYFKANNHHDIKQLGELSQQPPFNNPSIWREIS